MKKIILPIAVAKQAFTLMELMIVIVIIGILATVGMVMFGGQAEKAKIAASKANHKQVVKFIYVSVTSCQLGNQLILKQNPTTDTPDLCPDVLAGNADKMATQLSYHFSSLNWCNPMGWMGGSVCAEAVETSGTIGQGPTGTTQLITKSGSPSILFIDTKYTCEPLPLTEGCNQGKSLTDSVKLN